MTVRILVIDDEPKWLSFAEGDLGALFEVEVATDLTTIWTQLKKKGYDLIIASSGYLDILEAIRAEYPQERVVVATGQPTTREAIKTYRLGAIDYFAKDFRREVVSQKIRDAVEKPVKDSS